MYFNAVPFEQTDSSNYVPARAKSIIQRVLHTRTVANCNLQPSFEGGQRKTFRKTKISLPLPINFSFTFIVRIAHENLTLVCNWKTSLPSMGMGLPSSQQHFSMVSILFLFCYMFRSFNHLQAGLQNTQEA
jgi:hypothetical protein